jgi:dihydroorotate dehydrogenase electron transfer subunit
LIANLALPGGAHLLRVAGDDARAARPVATPGQFVQLLAAPSQHLLRRPMSVHDEGDGWRSFLVKPVGPASRELASLAAGAAVDASPPLGRGFAPAAELAESPLLLVGGGFGIAPLHFLARRLDALPGGAGYRILYGGRTARDLELAALAGLRGPVLPSTDDGSLGFHGTCVELAAQLVREAGGAASRFRVLTCGPHAMMAALYAALRTRVARVDVSLEEVMACGVGVCMGCVTPSVRGYVPVCTEGPVFRGDEVFELGAEVRHG